jgi:hypothetical protein
LSFSFRHFFFGVVFRVTDLEEATDSCSDPAPKLLRFFCSAQPGASGSVDQNADAGRNAFGAEGNDLSFRLIDSDGEVSGLRPENGFAFLSVTLMRRMMESFC